MNLSQYDDLCVRITLKDGAVYEGACAYDPEEYIVHEIGGTEDALEMAQWVFYRSDIAKVEVIGDDGFSAPYGRLEEETLADSFDLAEEVLFSEEPRSILRLLTCIKAKAGQLDEKEKYAAALRQLIGYTDDDKVKNEAAEIAAILEETE